MPEMPGHFAASQLPSMILDSRCLGFSNNEEVEEYRLKYQAFRRGEAKGAKNDIRDAAKRYAESSAALENRMLEIFQPTRATPIDAMVDQITHHFVETSNFCTANISEAEIADRFKESKIRDHPEDLSDYMDSLVHDVVNDSIHTSAPQMIGHMTSALPSYMMPLSKLLVAMNQNVVKTETAKTVTFLEREALAKLHRLIYDFDDAFYFEHIQNPKGMLGLFASGGTLANTSALWIARNQKLRASEDGCFAGVEREGLPRALRYHGYDDMIILGSALMHYSLDKAADLLGVGVRGLVKIPVDTNYQVDLAMMELKILEAIENKTLIAAVIGICGTTETGAIDDLQGMAGLAAKYGLHFHVDAAWGGPCIFSNLHRHKAKGIELADSVTLDGHKQLWLPMGCGMVFLKDPYAVNAVSKTANYIIRKDSYDLGKFTIDGSRGAQAIYLHANLELLGLRGYEVLFERTVRIARYMARCILRSTNFELLVKPMSNILLYRWIPASLRQKAWDATLTDDENEVINEVNRKLQDLQKQRGKTFVSRTTINAPKYNQKPIVGLRVVIGNPLTTEADIDAVFWDQDAIIRSHFISSDVTTSPEAIIDRDFGVPYPDAVTGDAKGITSYFDAVWAQMTHVQRFIFDNDIDSFYDAMITPDCFLEPSKHFVQKALRKAVPKTWGKPATGPTFNSKYPIEFRQSQIEGAGNGAWALVDIPKGTRLRRVAVADGTLVRFRSEQELKSAGWDIDDAVNYGIGHFADPSAIYFLNPGTAMNHADRTREPSVKYVHDEEGVLELWTVKDVNAGEEMFNEYHKDFAPCKWYDELQRSRGNIPLSQLNDYINALYDTKAL